MPKSGPLSVAMPRAPYHNVPPVAHGSGQYHFFVGPAAGTDAARQKEKKGEEPIARLNREKLRSKGKSCTKTNRCNPKVTVSDKSSKEGLRRSVWSTGCSQSFAVFEQLKGEFIGDGTNHSVRATCIGFRNRAFPTGSSWRHQATSPPICRRSTASKLPAPT